METIGFGTAEVSISLSYNVNGAPWMRTFDDDEFEPNTITLHFERWEGWLLPEIEIGGSDPRYKPMKYRHVMAGNVGALPEWTQRFVSTVDPDKELEAS